MSEAQRRLSSFLTIFPSAGRERPRLISTHFAQTRPRQLNWSSWHFLAFLHFSSSRISKRPEGREGLITGSTKLNTRLNGFHACRNRNRVCCMKCCRLTPVFCSMPADLFSRNFQIIQACSECWRARAPSGHKLKINCREISVWAEARLARAAVTTLVLTQTDRERGETSFNLVSGSNNINQSLLHREFFSK